MSAEFVAMQAFTEYLLPHIAINIAIFGLLVSIPVRFLKNL
jgi:hypothetical protein